MMFGEWKLKKLLVGIEKMSDVIRIIFIVLYECIRYSCLYRNIPLYSNMYWVGIVMQVCINKMSLFFFGRIF